MSYEYFAHVFPKGPEASGHQDYRPARLDTPNQRTEAGGGSGFPMRLCSGGQTQPQVDPKQQQQQVQGSIPMSFATQQSRPTTQLFQRPSTRLNAPRPHMISQPIPNANIQYSAPTMLLPPPPPFPQAVITLPHTTQIAGGRHQSHGGGQGGGSGGAPTPTFYAAPSQQQLFMQPPHTIPAYTQYAAPYMYPLRNNTFPTQNPGGPHPGQAAPQPPQHQPQQFVVESRGVQGGGGGGGGGGGQMMAPPHQPQQPAQPQVRQRRSHAIPIVNPQSGKDITEELYSENNSGESTASATPHSFPSNDRVTAEVAAEFAAKVAAAVAPATAAPAAEVILQPSIPNGPSSSTPPPPPPASSPPAEVPPVASPPQPIPPLHPQPPPPQAQIPTVSAKTDSPPVELPRPKVLTHSPGRKSTPVPSAVQPILDNPKKKEKKVAGIGSSLPPHREEPEEVRKPSFADAINIKNLQPVSAPQLPTPTPPPQIQPPPPEPETNGEPEVVVPPTPVPQAKHHEKSQEQQPSHDRGKTLPKKGGKGKKGGGVKEQNRRWQEKEGGGSDMDAFTSAPPAAPSPPPPAEPEPVTAPLPPQQPVPEREPTPPPPSPPPPEAPSPPLQTSNKNAQNEDEVEEMDESEELDEESIIVAVKNEENSKVSAAVDDEIEETIVNKAPVIEKAKPLLKYTYKEGQWSPLNPEGKKVYDRDFLLTLRTDDLSTKRPDIEDCDIIKTDSTNNNSISANNNNNRRQLHGSNSMSMNRSEGSFLPSFMKSSSSQRGSGMGLGGKRGSQQGGRPSRDGRSRNPYPSQQYSSVNDLGDLHWQKGGGWKPERCKTPPKLTEEEIKTEMLYKKVRGILNKLTPQKFDKLMEQILDLPIDTIERLTGVVGLVFDKAVDEPSFSRAYATLCQNLQSKLSIKIMDSDGNTPHSDVSFRKILLTKCQHMFEKKKREEKEGEEGKKSEEERVAELQQQIAEETDKDKKKELQLMLEEEERKIRVKYVGLARFIGELFKLNMLTSKIMFGCIATLLEKIEEESLECLCKLLTTVGKELELQARQSNSIKDLDDCFNKMRNLAKKTAHPKVSSRVRFMLQDVIELRGNKWVPRREDNNPKTMDQIQREAERETMLESTILQSSNTPRSKHSDRGDDRRRGGPRGGGGGNVQDSDGWIVSNKFRNYTFEPAKLQHLKGTDSEPASQNLGSHGQFKQWSYGSGAGSKLQSTTSDRRGMEYSTTNKFALLGDDKKMPPMMGRKVTPSSSLEKERAVQSVRDALSEKVNRNQSSNPPSRDSSKARSSASKPAPTPQAPTPEQEIPPAAADKKESEDPEVINRMKSWNLLQEWLANHNVQESADSITEAFPDPIIFVHSVMEKVIEGKETQRVAFGELLANLISMKIISSLGVAKELGEIIEFGEDSMIDLPFIWKYLGELLVPLLAKGVFTFADLKIACEQFRTPHLATTLKEIIDKLLKERGPVFIKSQWESSKVRFSDFIPEAGVDDFIKKNNYGFIIGEGEIDLPMNEVENILYDFLVQDGDKVSDHVCEWVKANVGSKSQDVDFIKALMRAVIKACIKNDKIVPSSLNKHSTLIKKFIDANETRELACLTGIMHLVVNEMESPVGLLVEIFQTLNDNNIISYEAFIKWKTHDKNDQGKGVAMASLSSFYVSLSEQDDSDEDST